MPHYKASQFRGVVRATSAKARSRVECPRCKAAPGDRCYKLRSWVPVEGHADGGFYTERQDSQHTERRAAAAPPAAPAAEPDGKNDLRRRINSTAMRKLTGNERFAVRYWTRSLSRTTDELAAKLAELESMPDLPVTRRKDT